MGMPPSQVSSLTSPAIFSKSVWSAPMFQPFSSLWPSLPFWNPIQQPMFSMGDLDTVLYGYIRRADDANKGVAVSGLQLGFPPYLSEFLKYSCLIEWSEADVLCIYHYWKFFVGHHCLCVTQLRSAKSFERVVKSFHFSYT